MRCARRRRRWCARWSAGGQDGYHEAGMRSTLLLLIVVAGVAHAQSPQEAYAARKLATATPAGYETRLVIRPDSLGPEAFSITPEGKTITVAGGDARGAIYGALALAEK